MYQITKNLPNSTTMIDRYQKLKGATSNAVNTTMLKACEMVKSKVEERAQIRNQPVVLTKKGGVFLRRVCGPFSDDSNTNKVDDN